MPARRKLSEVGASIPSVNRIESRSPALLPPVTLTPEEAAAAAESLQDQAGGLSTLVGTFRLRDAA